MENRGYAYALFTYESAFNQAIDGADPGHNMVVVDSAVNYHDFTSVVTFVQAGRRALLQHWNLTAGSSLAAAFQVTVAEQVGAPLPLYNWGGSTLFAGLTSPLWMDKVAFSSNGQKLQPASDGQAVVGYVATPTANQAGLVLGHSARTIVNVANLAAFVLEEVSVSSDAVRLAPNEIQFLLLVRPVIQSLSLSGRDRTLTRSAVSGQNYFLQYKGDLNAANWTDLPPAVLATGPTAAATDTNSANRRFYRIRVVP